MKYILLIAVLLSTIGVIPGLTQISKSGTIQIGASSGIGYSMWTLYENVGQPHPKVRYTGHGVSWPLQFELLYKTNGPSLGIGYSYETLFIDSLGRKDNNTAGSQFKNGRTRFSKFYVQAEEYWLQIGHAGVSANCQVGVFSQSNTDDGKVSNQYFGNAGPVLLYPITHGWILFGKPTYEFKYYDFKDAGNNDSYHLIHSFCVVIGVRYEIRSTE